MPDIVKVNILPHMPIMKMLFTNVNYLSIIELGLYVFAWQGAVETGWVLRNRSIGFGHNSIIPNIFIVHCRNLGGFHTHKFVSYTYYQTLVA